MSPTTIAGWAIAGVLATGGFAYVVKCSRDARFKAEAIAIAEQQIKELEKIAASNLKAKEAADAQREKESAALQRTIKRLRDNSSASLVPATASCAGSADTAAFDRAELDRALRDFTAGVQDLVGEGQQAVIDLDAAKAWRLQLSYALTAPK